MDNTAFTNYKDFFFKLYSMSQSLKIFFVGGWISSNKQNKRGEGNNTSVIYGEEIGTNDLQSMD